MTNLGADAKLRGVKFIATVPTFSSPIVRVRIVLRWLAAGTFVLAGANHFVNPSFYRRIVPPRFPDPAVLVAVSGLCEIAGGLGLLIRPLRRSAGWGLIALLIAVFPANVYMAISSEKFDDMHVPRGVWLHLVLWLRLPLQLVFVLWVWFVSLAGPRR